MTEKQITIIKEDGSETLCDILFTHYSKEFNKNYILFAEPGTDEVGAASYLENEDSKDGGSLQQIETDEEWKMLEELLQDYADQLENEDEEDEEEKEHSCSSCSGGCGSHSDEGCCGN